MIKKFLSALIMCLIFLNIIYSQNKEIKKDSANTGIKDKLWFGGDFGLWFGTLTYINLSPVIGYKLNKSLMPGIGLTYTYFNNQLFKFSSSFYGGSIFLRYKPFSNIFLHSEYEILNLKAYDTGEYVILNNVYIGGGIMMPLSSGVNSIITILYNVNESRYFPYQNPIIRVGINVDI